MNKRVLAATAIILGFIVFGVIGTRDAGDSVSPDGVADHLRADYDYYINDMLLDHFEASARHSYTLKADRVTHYPEGELSLLEEPHMTWFGAEQSPWELGADRGTMKPSTTGEGDALTLNGDVLATTFTSAGRAVQIHTESLDIVPATKSAHTVLPVRIETPSMYTLGTGMNIDMNTNEIELLSDVSGRYEPPANP